MSLFRSLERTFTLYMNSWRLSTSHMHTAHGVCFANLIENYEGRSSKEETGTISRNTKEPQKFLLIIFFNIVALQSDALVQSAGPLLKYEQETILAELGQDPLYG